MSSNSLIREELLVDDSSAYASATESSSPEVEGKTSLRIRKWMMRFRHKLCDDPSLLLFGVGVRAAMATGEPPEIVSFAAKRNAVDPFASDVGGMICASATFGTEIANALKSHSCGSSVREESKWVVTHISLFLVNHPRRPPR